MRVRPAIWKRPSGPRTRVWHTKPDAIASSIAEEAGPERAPESCLRVRMHDLGLSTECGRNAGGGRLAEGRWPSRGGRTPEQDGRGRFRPVAAGEPGGARGRSRSSSDHASIRTDACVDSFTPPDTKHASSARWTVPKPRFSSRRRSRIRTAQANGIAWAAIRSTHAGVPAEAFSGRLHTKPQPTGGLERLTLKVPENWQPFVVVVVMMSMGLGAPERSHRGSTRRPCTRGHTRTGVPGASGEGRSWPGAKSDPEPVNLA